ncbi:MULTISPECIES: Si-specific NAD(P)(+) transhydrogenase [Pseudoalteromonas]|uniref:Soluble pyridine nucleotide transhydrogenase n=1 Tax=Pseudoalteromonas lipolytica TaxID=570156 RepID=A0AAD0S1Z5_9GAMM|nr:MULTISPECIES: Si-specific NAD(P)(+) transhydrogenase [Pseudoalteromonas]AXV66635.1 Si-specific NAD(P)(+) transhydrogenase [Pseudoalteromonas donghaensis]EWH04763.1 pyridine nucleotide transhydrogenase [Pseudoalteromonas lipolytica SCSIO 04301]MBE0349444.1 NAD(P) transhydrogenase [Pseudoalteromonas lipolytica LMEB 39]MCC9661697.1 Si-specific NAD(P)(+) transhydrogenase [Pseudoalteromonas sp. MB41]QLJ08160.1 Si-specific NAD(P)(+) transhydrogenase [Pseudoalteromonas sp. JSTW]
MAKQNVKQKDTPSYQYDAIIIGTGPGGEGTAMNLSKSNKKVAVIERQESVGGGCVHWGTIPSKALRHSVSRYIEYKANPLFNISERPNRLTFPDILRHASNVISKQSNLRSSFYDRNRIHMYQGDAEFIDKHTVKITHIDGSFETLTAQTIVIATGSRPYRPPGVDFSHPRIYDSDTILGLEHDPHRVLIYGAGVIGCEYASIFKGLGAKVDLVNTRDRLLAFMDAEISDALSYHFWNSGIVIRHNEEFDRIETRDDCVVMHLKSGKRVKADCILFANGRTGNTDTLNLDAVGLKADSRGQLKVNETYQTEVDNIYAVGDVIGYPSLASAAFDQGRIAADAIACGNCEEKLIIDIPAGIYTIPEMSSVGKTEQELTAAKIPYEVGRAQFKHLARAQIAGTEVGSLKILFHVDTKEVLGVHCFGERASEIVHIGQAIMEQKNGGNTIDYFVNTTFNYPTMAEAYRVAALNGLNRLFK